MTRFSQYALLCVALGCILLGTSGCKGRHADATPNGETVEVVFPEPEEAPAQAAWPTATDTEAAPAEITPAQAEEASPNIETDSTQGL